MRTAAERAALVARGITGLLRPRTVAVIGASPERSTLGNQVLRNLRIFGFAGTVIPVHPRADVLEGYAAVPSIADLPEGVDVAVVSVRAARATGVLRELAERGCPAAVMPAAGFGDDELTELREALAELPIVVNGPNCLGTLSVADAAPLWTANIRRDFRTGNVALVTQSGSAAISVTTTSDLGFSRVVSSGNELSLSAADYLSWLAEDDETAAVGLVLESLTEPEAFRAAVRRVQAAGKRIVAVKVGRTSAGGRATQAHTGALVTGYDAYRALFRQLGVPVVRDYDELVSTLHLYSRLGSRPVGGNRLAVMSISGGQSALACDIATEIGATIADFAPETAERVRAALPGTTGENPVDIGASIDEDARRTAEAVAAVGADPGVDAIVVVQDAQEKLPLTPQHDYIEHVRQIVEGAKASATPVVVVSSTASPVHPMLAELVEGTNTTILRGLEPALVALNTLGTAPTPEDDASMIVSAEVVAGLRAEVSARHGMLGHALVQRILAAYGLPYARSLVVQDEDEAVAFAREVGFPLVVKIASPDVPHRVDVGGVVVGIRDEEALRAAVAGIRERMRALPHAQIDGYEVQVAVAGSIEAILGFTREDPLGSLVVVGSGGSLAELVGDRAVDLAPVTAQGARDLIAETHLGRLLSGYRKLAEPTDIGPLADAIVRFSALAADLGDLIVEADLNPTFVREGTGEITLVDALFIAR
ncbi:acetate--CoA ligase family protein [Microbacterium sp. ASV81]|uniref:Acetate--CoA ligase family protein n=1 Tax=Microbacterium capsulatum TaxID=3041921 RepID=A0ABU0XLG6_9MICO|nr:acetate--CoA ligase family protein [Microbacterium sp. ASV81]MDQ4214965.1 acetate--CoA ligase family protein [Microbacterium sp. ASV81]